MPNNIDLNIPNLLTPGTEYAAEISEDLQEIEDFINAPFNIAGQSISNDLSLDGYNLTNVRGVQFQSQPSTLSGSQDVNEIYVNQNNLGFNNSNGIFVPITSGNTLAINSITFTNFSIRLISSNTTILSTDTYNCINVNTNPGPITITLPIAATITPVAAGRLYLIRDVAINAGTNNITIQVPGGSGNVFGDTQGTSFTISSNGGYVAVYTDGITAWFTWTQNNYDSEIVQFSQSSELNLNRSSLYLANGSNQYVDNISSIQINGGVFQQTGGVLSTSGTTINYTNDTNVQWFNNGSGNPIETHGSGVIDTYDAGTTVTFNGVVGLAGTTNVTGTTTISGGTSISGTTNVSGITNFTGPMNMSSDSLVMSDVTVTGNTGTTISLDKTCTTTNQGYTETGAQAYITHNVGSSYVIDSGTFPDYYIGLLLTTSTGTITITMPPTPRSGRVICIGDVSGPTPSLSTYQINISPNAGQSMAVPGTTGSYGNIGVASSQSGLFAFWQISFIYVGTIWFPLNTISVIL